MTLDEARELLGVSRGAPAALVRERFRLRARDLHPDRHPAADRAEHERLAREFDRARQARDVLLLVAPAAGKNATDDSRGASPDPASSRSTSSRTTKSTSSPFAGPSQSAQAGPRARVPSPPRASLRFDEFVRQSDAAGFGPGPRTRRYHDVTRIVVWSSLGALTLGFIGYAAYLSAVII